MNGLHLVPIRFARSDSNNNNNKTMKKKTTTLSGSNLKIDWKSSCRFEVHQQIDYTMQLTIAGHGKSNNNNTQRQQQWHTAQHSRAHMPEFLLSICQVADISSTICSDHGLFRSFIHTHSFVQLRFFRFVCSFVSYFQSIPTLQWFFVSFVIINLSLELVVMQPEHPWFVHSFLHMSQSNK